MPFNQILYAGLDKIMLVGFSLRYHSTKKKIHTGFFIGISVYIYILIAPTYSTARIGDKLITHGTSLCV